LSRKACMIGQLSTVDDSGARFMSSHPLAMAPRRRTALEGLHRFCDGGCLHFGDVDVHFHGDVDVHFHGGGDELHRDGADACQHLVAAWSWVAW